MDGARERVLLDAFGFGVSGLACVPGPGLPVRIQGEDSAGGCDGCDGLRLSGQAGCFLLVGLRVQVLDALEVVNPALPVHCEESVIAHADAGELGVLPDVEDGGRGQLVGPSVDVLVGS